MKSVGQVRGQDNKNTIVILFRCGDIVFFFHYGRGEMMA
jgi:hypothetical protein